MLEARPPRRRRIPQQVTGADVCRPGFVYGIPILDSDGRVRIDYVGKTRNPRRRELEHREDQPFGDRIVGGLVILAQGNWTDRELDDRETLHIARVRPRHNFEKNQHNPDRIPIWLAREQRWARDRAAGRPLWVPPEQREGRPVRLRESPRRPYRRPSWVGRTRRRVGRVAVVAAVWSGLFAVLFFVTPARVSTGSAAGGCAFAATIALALLQPRRRRRRRRR